jgi:hypothetical protein
MPRESHEAARMQKIQTVIGPAAAKNPSKYYRVWFRDTVLKEFETFAEVHVYLADLPLQVVVTAPQNDDVTK